MKQTKRFYEAPTCRVWVLPLRFSRWRHSVAACCAMVFQSTVCQRRSWPERFAISKKWVSSSIVIPMWAMISPSTPSSHTALMPSSSAQVLASLRHWRSPYFTMASASRRVKTLSIVPADNVIMAIGATPNTKIVRTTSGLENDDHKFVITREVPYGMTTRRGVFAA